MIIKIKDDTCKNQLKRSLFNKLNQQQLDLATKKHVHETNLKASILKQTVSFQ